jgi:hypothetical protein
MIDCPPGWRATRVEDGLWLVPTVTPPFAEIRYRLRHPLEPLPELMARKLTPPGFVVQSLTPPEALVTDEGEYASLIVVRGLLDGRPVQRDIGMVYGDDYYALLLGVVVEAARFAEMTELVRQLVRSDRQLLGTQRRRRFRYVPPAGWREQQWDFESTWIAPDLPSLRLTVLPALPSQGAGRAAVAQLVATNLHGQFVVTRSDGPEPAQSQHGLSGQRWRLAGRLDAQEMVRHIVILQDERYIYCARLETVDERGLDALAALVASIEPIPRPRVTRGDLEALKHWIE